MLLNRTQVANHMNPVLTLFPAAAAFAIFLSAFPVDDFRPGLLFSPPPAQTQQELPKRVELPPVALALNVETPAKKPVSKSEGSTGVIAGPFSNVPLVPNVAVAFQFTAPRIKIAFEDTAKDADTVPAPKAGDDVLETAAIMEMHDLPEEEKVTVDHKQKFVERKHGRIRLLKGIVFDSLRPKTSVEASTDTTQNLQGEKIPQAAMVSDPDDTMEREMTDEN